MMHELKLGLVFCGFTLTSLAFSAPAILPVGEGVCQTRNDAGLSEAVPMLWKNARDTPVAVRVLYKDVDGAWLERALEIDAMGEVSLEVSSRCLYWYAKRGNAFYGPKAEKNNASDVRFMFDGDEVQAIALDLNGKEGIDFTFTLR